MEKVYAIVSSTGCVDNLIMWDGVTDFTPPENYILVEVPEGVEFVIGEQAPMIV